MTKKKNGLSREQAGELYQDLQKTMAKMLKNEAEYYNAKGIKVPASNAAAAAKLRADGAPSPQRAAAPQPSMRPLQPIRQSSSRKNNSGALLALAVVIGFASARVVLSGLEFSGLATATPVEASYMNSSTAAMKLPKSTPMQFSKEEMQILTSLDARRVELDERNKRLDDREQDMEKKDKEFAMRITELRELTEKLNVERGKNEHKKTAQLEQLSNVYGSMNPEEAAHLMEQLDITISLSLIERMPEKRIGQILALMNPERALALTKMLSGRAK